MINTLYHSLSFFESDMIHLVFDSYDNKATVNNTVFFTGSTDDVNFFLTSGYNIHIVNRNSTNISGTMVRNKLKNNEDISNLVNNSLENYIKCCYNDNKVKFGGSNEN
jgi:nicotinic acid mononucleotide adenylyltransferase